MKLNKLLLTLSLAAILIPSLSQAKINPQNKELMMNPAGWTKKTANDTIFEAMDVDGLPIKVISSKPTDLDIISIPEVILININKDSGNTKLLVQNLKPNTKYYKYADNFHNLEEIISNSNGEIEFKQDIKENHLIFIKTHKSTKYINSTDGGACSQFGTWDQNTLTCTLTQDVDETIQIDSNNITLDGNYHTINPTRSNIGIYAEDKNGIIVKNTTITNASFGMMFHGITNGIMTSNTVTDSSYGIWMQHSSGNQITANSSNHNSYSGIFLTFDSGNVITANTTVLNGGSGIEMSSGSTENNFDYNVTKDNTDIDFKVEGVYDGSTCSNQISNTTGTGDKEIAFFNSTVAVSNKEYSSLILCNANNSTFDNITVSGRTGIVVSNTNGAKFSNINFSNNKYGLYLLYSHSNEIFSSKIDGDDYGVWINYSDGNSIHNNIINNSINVDGSNTEIHHNTISNSPYAGIYLSSGYNNTIHSNNFISNAGDDVSSSDDNPAANNNYYSKNTNCTDTDVDGYCDSYPYQVSWNVSDGQPLKNPVSSTMAAAPLHEQVADLAVRLVDWLQGYTWGAKGWNFDAASQQYVDAATIKSGYTYYNPDKYGTGQGGLDFGHGVDCSGLVIWAFNRTNNPTEDVSTNFVNYEGADTQYKYQSGEIFTDKSKLTPGDTLYFNTDSNPDMDHTAMYVGLRDAYDIVNASSPSWGIKSENVDNYAKTSDGFVAFKHIGSGIVATSMTFSPNVDVSITDPDGNVFYSTKTSSYKEDDMPGNMYYSYTKDKLTVYSPLIKKGDYKISVFPKDRNEAKDDVYGFVFKGKDKEIKVNKTRSLDKDGKKEYTVTVGDDISVSEK